MRDGAARGRRPLLRRARRRRRTAPSRCSCSSRPSARASIPSRATVFRPRPNVDSALVAFSRTVCRRTSRRVKQVVEGAFAHRRKTLANSLALAGVAARERAAAALDDDRPRPGRARRGARRRRSSSRSPRRCGEARAARRRRSTSRSSSARRATDGMHEVATVFQRIDLCDRDRARAGRRARASTGFADDTLVRARARERSPTRPASSRAGTRRSRSGSRSPPGLGGGSSDAATALRLANALLAEPLPRRAARTSSPRRSAPTSRSSSSRARSSATGDGTEPRAARAAAGLLGAARSCRTGAAKESTARVYAALRRARRRARLRGAARGAARRARRVERPRDLAALPPNDLASSPLRGELVELGAFRADVSGAGPTVYGLFAARRDARAPHRRRSPGVGGPGSRPSVVPLTGHGVRAQHRSSDGREHDAARPLAASAASADRALDRGRRGPSRRALAATHAAGGRIVHRGRSRSRFYMVRRAATSSSRTSARSLLDRRRLAGARGPRAVILAFSSKRARDRRRRSSLRRVAASLVLLADAASSDREQRDLDSACLVGRSQVVRQRVLVPRSQVRILAPQPSSAAMTDDLAAVVMAAGLGTRMQLRDAEAPAPAARPAAGRLGRSTPSRPLGADPLVVVAVAATRRTRFDGRRRSPSSASRSARATRSAPRASALDGSDDDVLVLVGRRAAPDRRAPARARRRAPRAGAAATVLSFEPPDARAYGRIVRDDDGAPRARSSRTRDADARAARASARSTRRSTSSTPTSSGRRSNGSSRQRAGRALPHRRRAAPRRGRRAGRRVHVLRMPLEVEGVNTRAELADAAACLRDRDQRAHMLAGVTIVDPETTWIEPDVELEPDVDDPPVHGPARPHARRGRRRGRPARRRRSTPRSARMRRSGPFCYLRPGTRLGAGAKAGTFVEIKNSEIGAAHEGAAPLLHRRRRGRRGHEHRGREHHRELPAPARPAQGEDQDRAERQDRHSTIRSMAPVEVGDDAWIAGGSVITEDVPPESLAGFPPRQITKEGYLRGNRND